MNRLRNNVTFASIKSKMIRSRKTNSGSSVYSSSIANTSARAMTLGQKIAAMTQNRGKTSTATTMLDSMKTDYTAMKSAAQGVQTTLGKLMSTTDGALFPAAEKSESTSSIINEVKSFVEDYNEMIKRMNSEGGSVNQLYVKQLHTYAVANKSKLESIGITEDNNGLLVVDQSKLQAADLEKLKNVFQGESSFAAKVAESSKKVEANADTNLNSINSATYSSLLANYGTSGNKYNFLA